jgi:hypothetical protein
VAAFGRIGVEQEGETVRAVFGQKLLLLSRERGAHERGGRNAELMEPKHRPVALDDDEVLGIADAMSTSCSTAP